MTNTIDLGKLVRRLKMGGELAKCEREALLIRAANSQTDEDIHNLARAVALSEPPTPEYVAMIAPLLSEKTNDYDLWGVILALCSYWKLTEQFASKLLEIVQRPTWPDEFSQAGRAALREIGTAVYLKHSNYLLGELVRLYDESYHSNDSLLDWQLDARLSAIQEAIDVALNGPDVIAKYIAFKVPDDVDEDLIRRARKKASM